MRPFLLSMFVAFFGVSASLTYAESPPIPKSKAETLSAVQDKLHSEELRTKSLKKQRSKIDLDLKRTKNKLISIAEQIQTNETAMEHSDQRILALGAQKKALGDTLEEDRVSIGNLILALERIRRTPPEALIARTDQPYKTALSAMLMHNILPAIERHAQMLQKNVITLNSLTDELKEEKSTLVKHSRLLDERRKNLSALVGKRKKLFAQTNKDIKIQEIAIQSISLQAKSLKELVQRIKKEELAERKRQEKLKRTPKKTKTVLQALPSAKRSKLPISGIIRTGYNQRDTLGAKSKGLTLEGRGGGLVIAPISGKVQFTGAFKRYGNIIIIEHKGGYHSLVAGLGKITTTLGAIVKVGEPIGSLPNSSLIPRPKLYYELRKNGKPVNPSIKFSQLG